MKKRWLSLLLALCMILSLFPVSAFAVSDGDEEDGEASTEWTYFEVYAEGDSSLWVEPNATPTLSVTVDTDGDLDEVAYQWGQYVEEVDEESGEVSSHFEPFSGATDSSCTLEPVECAGQYACVATAPNGDYREVGFSIQVENNLSAEFTEDSQDYVELNHSAELAVTVEAIDLSRVTYQWYVLHGDNWNKIDGAVDSSYTTEPITDVTDYRCVVNDGFGSTIDPTIRVRVDNHFEANASGDTYLRTDLGTTAELQVVSSGVDLSGVTYQWYHLEDVTHTEEDENGDVNTWTVEDWVEVPGATGASFTTEEITKEEHYHCALKDRFQNEDAVYYTLIVDNHLDLEAVGDQELYVQPNETVTLQVSASADDMESVTYQWYRLENDEEVPLEGETGTSLTTEPIEEYSIYYCLSRDAYGGESNAWFYIHVDNDFRA